MQSHASIEKNLKNKAATVTASNKLIDCQKHKNDKFNEIMEQLGRAALTSLKKHDYELDPLVGDWSCQLRTLWLIKLIQESDLDHLSREQLQILGIYKFLTDSIAPVRDEFSMITSQATNIKYCPVELGKISNKELRIHYGTAKKRLASFITDYLSSLIANSHIEDKEAILEVFNQPTYTEFSAIPIRIVEFFTGYLAIMRLAIEHQISLVIALYQFSLDNEGKYSLTGANTLLYQPTEAGYECIEDKTDLFSPSIVMEMYTALTPANNNNKLTNSHFLNYPDFEQFCSEFKKQDIMKIILAIAATHAQFPPQAWLIQEGKKCYLAETMCESHEKLKNLFQDYFFWGIRNKVGTAKYYSSNYGFFKDPIAINIHHVYVSNFRCGRS